MENDQARELVFEMKKLWSSWKSSIEEEQVYRRKFNYYEYESMKKAIEEHKSSKQGSMSSPKLYHILEIYRTLAGQTGKRSVAVVCYEIECIAHKEMPWRIGERAKFWATDKKYVYRGKKQEAAAIKSAEDTGSVWGGTWIPRLINHDIEEE